MCGIGGFAFDNKIFNDNSFELVLDRLQNRGPDNRNIYKDKNNNLILLHSRLSIIDLTDLSNQPIESFDKNLILTFNGEIYNYKNIRNKIIKEFNFNLWKTNSDTETLLYCFYFFGIEKTLKMIEGMFAIALWDKKNKSLLLARDRNGEKPLYYGVHNDIFLFCSDLNALKNYKYFEKKINMQSLDEYLNYGYIAGKESIYKNICKLTPGHFLTVNEKNYHNSKSFLFDELDKKTKNINQNFKTVMENAIIKQSISDVPLGVFLSSGVDSSIITYFLTKLKKTPVHTFNAYFEDKKFNEKDDADYLSKIFKTKHTSIKISDEDFSYKLNNLFKHLDEPISDPAVIPTMILSENAKTKVKVCMTGEGGDELFNGYPRYKNTITFDKLKQIGHFKIKYLKYLFINKFFVRHKYLKLIDILNPNNELKDIYFGLVSNWIKHENFFINNEIPVNRSLIKEDMGASLKEIQNWDLKYYLSNNLLKKSDSSSMAYGLELRSPFLDKSLFNFKIEQENKGLKFNKNLLIKLMEDKIPSTFFQKKKKGFEVPISRYLNNNEKDKFNELTSKSYIKKQNLFNYNRITNYKNEFFQKNRDWKKGLWSIYMFQLWHAENF